MDKKSKTSNAQNDLQKQIRVLQAANRIAHLLNQTQQVDQAVTHVIEEFLELVEADEGSIQLLRPTTEHTRRTLIRKGVASPGTLDSRLDDLITGWVTSYKEPLLTHDVVAFLSLKKPEQRYADIRSLLAAPILVGQKSIGGVILIRNKTSAPFSTADQNLVADLVDEIADFIEDAELREQLFHDYERLQKELSSRYRLHGIIGRSPAMQQVFDILERVIPTEGRVLIHGESGTGKELFAKILHHEGPRKDGTFVAVDCGALPANLLESELFGYVKGAFTGAQRDRKGLLQEANGGTLFLDEITNMNLETQTKLLRVLQEGEIRPLGSNEAHKVDVRIITAASEDLKQKVSEGIFRSDLFYRLNVVPIYLPPLRERTEDIAVLATHFLGRFAKQHDKNLRTIAASSIKILEAYPWPGNVRELENVIERAVILADPKDTTLLPEHLPYEISFPEARHEAFEVPLVGKLPKLLADYEKEILLKVLRHHNWNKTAAARALNISERVVRYKMKRLKIKAPK